MIHFLVVRVQFRNVLSLLKFNFNFNFFAMVCNRFMCIYYRFLCVYVYVRRCRRSSSHGTSIKNINFHFRRLSALPFIAYTHTESYSESRCLFPSLSLSLSLFCLCVCVFRCVVVCVRHRHALKDGYNRYNNNN